MTNGEAIKKIRLEKGLTQEQFAEIAGVLKQSVSLWELGKTQPSITAVNKLSEAFGMDRNVLFNRKETGPHWVSAKERLPQESGKYVCAALCPNERGGSRKIISIFYFEKHLEPGGHMLWEAPRSIITHWLEGLEMPDMEGVL